MLKPAGDGQVIAQLTELLAVEGGLVPRSSDLYRQEAMEAKALLADVQNELRKLEEENMALRKQHQEASRLAGQDAVAMERDRQRIAELEREAEEERAGNLVLRAKFGAVDDETCYVWIERLFKTAARVPDLEGTVEGSRQRVIVLEGLLKTVGDERDAAIKDRAQLAEKAACPPFTRWARDMDAKRVMRENAEVAEVMGEERKPALPALPGLDQASGDVQRVIARMLSAAMDLIEAEAKVRAVEALLNPPAKDDE